MAARETPSPTAGPLAVRAAMPARVARPPEALEVWEEARPPVDPEVWVERAALLVARPGALEAQRAELAAAPAALVGPSRAALVAWEAKEASAATQAQEV